MTIGASLLLIAIGAILRFAVTATVSGVDLGVIGVIFIVIGVVGLILGLVLTFRNRSVDGVQGDANRGQVRRTTYTEQSDQRYPDDTRY